MLCVLKNIINKNKSQLILEYIKKISLRIKIIKKIDSNGTFFFQRLTYNEAMSSDAIKNVIFSDEVIKSIKEKVGDFYLINYVDAMLNSYGHKAHRDGQSFGFSYDAIKKSSKIIKVLFYFNTENDYTTSENSLDVNLLNFNLKNIFFNKKLFMKINFYYEFYLRSRIMKSLNNRMGDIVLMDNNCWHRASQSKYRFTYKNEDAYQCKKFLIAYEICTERNLAIEYSKYVRDKFIQDHEKNDPLKINTDYLDDPHLDVLKSNNIEVFNP